MRTTKAVIKEVCYNDTILAISCNIRSLYKLLETLPTSLGSLARSVNSLTTPTLVAVRRGRSSSASSY